MKRKIIFFINCILLVAITFGCSLNKADPVTPSGIETNDNTMNFNPNAEDDRTVIGVWYAEINPDKNIFTIEPVIRNESFHFPLNSYFPNVLAVVDYDFNPYFWADIKLSHPLPGSGIDVFDPRVIAILPARDGYSFFYPTFNVYANNKIIKEPDGYTPLWDHSQSQRYLDPEIRLY